MNRLRAKVVRVLGGPARAHIIVVLAAIFALHDADLGAVGAMAGILQRQLGIGEAQVGLLLTASSGALAVATLFFGWLVDRTNRVRLLFVMLLVWGGVMVAVGLSQSYAMLVITRIGLGVTMAVSTPAIASLTGDYFPARERASAYSFIISGELIGTAIGFGLSGELASLSWRFGFWVLALPAPFLAWAIHRLPEPERGGAGWIGKGQLQIKPQEGRRKKFGIEGRLAEMTREAGIAPREELISVGSPARKSLAWAAWYVLRIPTNLVLIISSALGYYFLAGIRTFGVEYFSDRFHVGHAAAILALGAVASGALVGVYFGGWLADDLLRRGHLRARVWVSTCSYLASAVFMAGGLFAVGAWAPWLFFFSGAFALGATSPPLDSARLDIVHPDVWGRAESIRVVLRNAGEAVAPFLFGFLAASVFGGGLTGLTDTFELMLIPLIISGLLGLITFRTYPRDVATAEEYAERTLGERQGGA